MQYDEMSTDELLELLPNNLHLARNDNAPEHDRFRVYNSAIGQYEEPGASSARDLLVSMLTRIDEQRREWLGRSVANHPLDSDSVNATG